MSKRKRSPQNRPARKPKQRRGRRPPDRRQAPSLLDEVSTRLDDPSPLGLLSYVSGLLNAVDPRNRNPFDRGDPEFAVDELVASFLDMPSRETSALLAVIAAFTDDDLLRARIRRELTSRRDELPAWLAQLPAAVPVSPLQVTETLGSGENVLVGTTFADGAALTAAVFVDHNLGSVVKDAYPIDGALAEVRAVFESAAEQDDVAVAPIAPADARARIADAIASGARTFPPYESDTWPACRPLVEWMCAQLPPGGTGFEYREWTEAETKRLADAFFASEHGAPWRRDRDARATVQSLIWFGTGYSTLDPYRWGTPKLELLLLDWIPRKIMDNPASLARYPDVIRAFVAFGHEHVGVPARFTVEAWEAIDAFEPEYLDLIADGDRPQGVAALFDAMGVPMADDLGYLADDIGPFLEDEVGGPDALAALDAVPLPDEPFDGEGLGEAVRDRLTPVVAQLDDVVGEVFGVEARTACRRLARRVALAEPAVITRAKRDEVTAAALCWMVATANGLFGPVLVKDVLARFGLASGGVSQRVEAIRRGLGLRWDSRALGTADLLVSSYRQRLLALRDEG